MVSSRSHLIDAATLRETVRRRITSMLGDDLDGLYLFGSRARGDAAPDSDWDVLVMLRDEADWPGARAAMRKLTGELAAATNEIVSIVALRWRDAPGFQGLLRNVAEEGQRL